MKNEEKKIAKVVRETLNSMLSEIKHEEEVCLKREISS